jgi:hypothetical protein
MFSRNFRWFYRKPKLYKDVEDEELAREELIKYLFGSDYDEIYNDDETSLCDIKEYDGEADRLRQDATRILEDTLMIKYIVPSKFEKIWARPVSTHMSETRYSCDSWKMARFFVRVKERISSNSNSNRRNMSCKPEFNFSAINSGFNLSERRRSWTIEMPTIPVWGSTLEKVYDICGCVSERNGTCIPKFIDIVLIHVLERSSSKTVLEDLSDLDLADKGKVSQLRCDTEINAGNSVDVQLLENASIVDLVCFSRNWLSSVRDLKLNDEESFWLCQVYEYFTLNFKGKLLQPVEGKVSRYQTIDSLESMSNIEQTSMTYIASTGFSSNKAYFEKEDYPRVPLINLVKVLKCYLLLLRQHHRHLLLHFASFIRELSDKMLAKENTTNAFSYKKVAIQETMARLYAKYILKTVDSTIISEDVFALIVIFLDKINRVPIYIE